MAVNEISSVQPQVKVTRSESFAGERRPVTERIKDDYKPDTFESTQGEKASKNKKKIIAGVVTVAALTTAALLLFKTNKGKALLEKIKNFFKGKKAAETTKDVYNVDIKHVKGKGRKILEEAVRDVPTAAEQAAYDASIAYVPPTKAQRKIIKNKCSKPATNTLGDFMEAQGITKTKAGTLAKAEAVKPTIVKAADVLADNSAKIEKLQANIAKLDENIAKYKSHKAMAKYAKPLEASKAKMLKELEQLQAQIKAAA